MVSVTWGASAPQPGLASLTAAAMIGCAAALPAEGGTDVNPVHVYSVLELTSTYGLTTDDIIVKAATDFFNAGGTDLWAYVLVNEDNSATYTDVELTGIKNSVNKTFSCPYSPVSDITNLEYSVNGVDWTATADFTKIETIIGSGIYTGSVLLGATVPAIDATYTIRADIATSGVGKAIDALQAPEVVFNALCFAYDQSLAATGALITDNFRYKQTRTYSNTSWLGDVLEGATSVSTLNAAGKRCIFMASLPDSVTPTTLITSVMANGTAYDAGTSAYNTLKTIIGTNAFVSLFVAEQTTDGSELAANTMGALMSDEPRKPFKYYPIENLSQTTFPTQGEISNWDTAQINVIASEYFSNGTQFTVVGGNHTLGTGWEGKINYVRCKNILTNKLIDNLKAVLLTREIKFTSRGSQHVYDVIDATLDWAIANNYIDGKSYILIPVKSYLENEATLTEGQQSWLDTERATGIFNNIEIAYEWKGDVDKIIISALIGE
jgi:hypothetical protein